MPQVWGSRELMEDVHERELCIGCGACVDICPYFKNYKGKTSQLFSCTLDQGRCFAYCPKAEVDLDHLSRQICGVSYDGSPLGAYRQVLAGRAGRNMEPASFQAGGTVSALLAFAMKKGMIDAAALTDREALTPVARLVTDWREIAGCAASKFTAAPTVSSVNRAVHEGYTRIGIVGTPCQMVAVAQMRCNPLAKAEHHIPLALAVGLFCNWSLDTRPLAAFLSQKLDISGIRGMDIPPPPSAVMVLNTEKGSVEIPLSEIKPLIPHTCFICPDMTSELADVSVGMFEGRPQWNTLIVRSEKGAALVDEARREGFLETDAFPAKNLSHLSQAAADKKERSMRTLLRRSLINNRNGERAALRVPPEVVEKILSDED